MDHLIFNNYQGMGIVYTSEKPTAESSPRVGTAKAQQFIMDGFHLPPDW
jgi:hypothetical protein